MPTYEYQCKACDFRFELFQSMSDKPKRKCPKCGKNSIERLIGTGSAVLFKGSGFYQTDYRPESYKKAAAAEQGSSSSGGDSSAGSTTAPSIVDGTKAASKSAKEPSKANKPAKD